MKKLAFLLIGLLISIQTTAQSDEPCESCLPEGIALLTQSQIDSFQINYPNCTEIEGGVWIEGNDITNLNGLSVLTSIGGYLGINGNDVLTSMTGLDNLTSVGGFLEIYDNEALTSLTGLYSLTIVGDYLKIEHNTALTSLTGLDNLTSIGGSLIIAENIFTSLIGLDNVTYIRGLSIHNNNSLTSISALGKVTSIEGSLSIYGNEALTSLTGLDNVTSIEGSLSFLESSLTSLTALNNVTSIGGSLGILANGALTSLTGLDNVTYMGEDLVINYNDALNSLVGLENVTSIGGSLWIYYNPLLSQCEVESICAYLDNPNGTVEIYDNAVGCNSPEEVQDSCEANAVNIDEQYIRENLILYPNPASTTLTINTDNQTIDEIRIYNLTGQLVMRERPSGNQIDVSGLKDGLYVMKCLVEGVWYRQKVVIRK
jgi:hypothetical protein